MFSVSHCRSPPSVSLTFTFFAILDLKHGSAFKEGISKFHLRVLKFLKLYACHMSAKRTVGIARMRSATPVSSEQLQLSVEPREAAATRLCMRSWSRSNALPFAEAGRRFDRGTYYGTRFHCRAYRRRYSHSLFFGALEKAAFGIV